MSAAYWITLLCGALAVLYGIYAIRAVTSVSAGNDRMQEIALAIQEGATMIRIGTGIFGARK